MTSDELAAREDTGADFGLCPRCTREMDGPYATCVMCALTDAQAEYRAAIERAAERLSCLSVEGIAENYSEVLCDQRDAA